MAISIQDYGVNAPDLFDVYFGEDRIQTLVTKEPGKVRDWIIQTEYIHRAGLNRLIVGLDVEWRPNYSRQQNPVAILQLCVDRRCLIFQLRYCGSIPSELFRFLANSAYSFVGVGIKDDVDKLSRDYCLEVSNVVDLRNLAASASNDSSLRNVGLKDLARIYLDVEMVKPRGVMMSKWDRALLTNEQVKYACVDAFVSFKLGMVLNASAH